jgi:HK97 family phage major capsid protein
MKDTMKMRRQLRQLVDQAKELNENARDEGRDFTPAEQRQYDGYISDADKLRAEISTEERSQQLAMEGPTAPEDRPGNSRAGISNREGIERYGFQRTGVTTDHRSLGEFVHAIKFDQRNLTSALGAKGGWLVPDQLQPGILMPIVENSIVRPRAEIIFGEPGRPDAQSDVPALDQAGAFLGGVEVTWISEGDLKPQQDFDIRLISLTPYEVAATLTVTDKLLRNSADIGPFIDRIFREAVRDAEDSAFLVGDGIGKPLGAANAPCRIDVARTAPAQVVYADLAAMLARWTPGSLAKPGRACWVAHQSLLPQLTTMIDAGGHLVWQESARGGIPSTLMGIPIEFSGRTPSLGNRADLMLVDWSYYLIKQGHGPVLDVSNHPLFTSNRSIIKVYDNCDGHPWVNAAILLSDGVTTVSPIVCLD